MRRTLAILVMLLFGAMALADDLRWGGTSDNHYGTTWTWTLGASMSPFLTYIETNYNLQFVVFSGDVGETQASGPTTCATNHYPEMFADWQALTIPYYATAGNHDLVQWAGTYGNFNCWTNYFSRHVAWTNGNYVFFGLPAYIPASGTNGALFSTDIDWMENTMSNAVVSGYTNFITVEHFPLILDSATASAGSLVGDSNFTRFTNLLNQYSVVLNLHGHTHSVDALSDIVPNTTAIDRLLASSTLGGSYEVFYLTNTTLITRRYRTADNSLAKSWTNTVPQYIANFNPSSLPCDVGPRIVGGYSTVSTNSITVNWPANTYSIARTVQRRVYTNNPAGWNTWSDLYDSTTTPDQAGSFVDSTVSVGIPYEYELGMFITNVICNGTTNPPTWYYQYISTGIQVPTAPTNGNVILLVESGVASALSSRLTTLTNDLILSGYKVFRHDVAADDVGSGTWSNAVVGTKTTVTNDFATDPNNRWTLFIVGHVPIPYSGVTSPGGHTENYGAHPSDWYYVITNASAWTDSTANNSTGDYAAQHNVPNDGKFDQDVIPATPVMRVGRIDFRNLPGFTNTETQLLQQYLDRDHLWRTKGFTVRSLGLINSNNNAGQIHRGKPYDAHSIMSSMFGTTSNTVLGTWLGDGANTNGYLYAASYGNGHYDADLQIGSITNFAQTNFYAPFSSMFGSYYGDYDSAIITNVVLWGPLASAGYGLNVFYGDDIMVEDSPEAGGTMAQKVFEEAVNFLAPVSARYRKYVTISGGVTNTTIEQLRNFVSLLGDPTLSIYSVAPASNVSVYASGTDAVVSWAASPDTNIAGYYVYRAPNTNRNAFVTLTPVPTNAPFTDVGGASTNNTWWVRAVKLESSANRSFNNLSQGALWTGTLHTNYYVATNGNNSNPGTQANPFLTVQKGIDTARAGDQVIVGAGTYAENVRTADNAGASGAPITIDGQGVATIRTVALENPYLTFQNFTVTGGTNLWTSIGYIARNANFCVISNNTFDGAYLPGYSDLVRFDSPQTGPYGPAVNGGVVISNTFKRGFICPVLTIYGSNIVVKGNAFLDSDTCDWVRLFGCSNAVVCNVFSNMWSSGALGNHPDLFQTFGTGVSGSQYITVASNLFVKGDMDTQICMTSDDNNPNISDLYVFNNKFIGISSKGTLFMRNAWFFNNLFVDCSTNLENNGAVLVYGVDANGNGSGGRVFNNVFYRCGDSATNSSITYGWYSFSLSLSNVMADYNYVAKTGYASVATNLLHQSIGDPGGWDDNKFWETHGINGGNPNFAADFSVSTNSFLYAAGTNLSSLFTTDITGKTRPSVGAWTIGAFEAGTSGSQSTSTASSTTIGAGSTIHIGSGAKVYFGQ